MTRTAIPNALRALALVALGAVTSANGQPGVAPLAPLAALASKLELAVDAAIDAEEAPGVSKAERAARDGELQTLQEQVERLRRTVTRGQPVTADEIDAVSRRLDRFMKRVGAPPVALTQGEIPAGVELDVRLSNPASPDDVTKVAKKGIVTATTLVDLRAGETVLIPAGSTLRGVLVQEGAKRLLRGRQPVLRFYTLEVSGVTFAVDLSVAGDRSADARVAPRDAVVRLRFNSPLTLQ